MSNDKPLTKDQQIDRTALALQARYGFNTPSGRTKALYEGSKHDDILFSKKYKDTLIASKRDGLISNKDAQRIGSYMAERAVQLANSGQAKGFTPEGEYKPWISKADMRKQREAAKAQYGEDIDAVAAADRAQMAASGYRPSDLQNQGYKLPEGTPWASGYEMPMTGAGMAQDPLHELGIYGQQVARGIVGSGQGLTQNAQALGARMMGQDPSAVVQEGDPAYEAGQVTGQRLGASATALPITVPAMSAGGAAGSAIGGGIGSFFGPGGRIAGQVIGGFLGGAAGAYGGHHLANWAGTGAMNMLLGQAANAKLQEKQEGMANKYPLAARYGESALEVSMFAPRIMPEGFSPKLAAAGFKQAGMRGLKQGITDQGLFLNSFVEGGGEGALALWQAKQQSDREKELGMPGKSAMDILAEGAFGALFQKETKFGKKVFGKLSGREFMENRANAQQQFSPTSVEGLAGKSARQPSTGVVNATMTPEGWRRINLGGRIKGGTDAEGNPIVSGARYAVYNPTERKAHIYTDNDFALTGERTRNAAFNLTVADKLFKHNPIMGYKDPTDGVQRMVLGITRDAGVRVRDIKGDMTSEIKVVPLSQIRDAKIAKRIDEVMQEQGVLANKAPAPHTPEAFKNADKIAFPDEVTLDETGPVAARVVSQIGKTDSNMFVVALPDGSHVRLNGGSINVGKPGKVLVRGKLAESHFPTSLADLVAPKGGLENQAFIKDGETFHHLQLTPDQKSIYAKVKNMFGAEIRAAKDEPDDARREAMIGIVKNKMGEAFAKAATIPEPSGKFKDADVIDINLEQSKFKGVPQTAIVVGRNKFGYQVRLVDHLNVGEFTVPESLVAGYDPSMGKPAAETNYEGPTADGKPAAKPAEVFNPADIVPPGQPLGPKKAAPSNESRVSEGEKLTVEDSPLADHVDFHEIPDAVRTRIENALAKHGEHIKELAVGNAITLHETTADAIHDLTIKRIDPTSWGYTLRTAEVDPKSRQVTNQYISDYTLSIDDATGNIIATSGKPSLPEIGGLPEMTDAGQTVMAYQSQDETGTPSTPQAFEPGSTTRGRAALARRYVVGRVDISDWFEFKRRKTAIEQNSTLTQAEKERQMVELNKDFQNIFNEMIRQGLYNLNRTATEVRVPADVMAQGSREERYGYKVKKKVGNDLSELQYSVTDEANVSDREVVQVTTKMGKNTFLLNAVRVNNKKQLATVLAEQYKINPQVASYVSDIVDRFARGWALDKVTAQLGRSHDLFESTGNLQKFLANKKPGDYLDTRSMYFRQFARTEPEVNKAVSEFMREFYRERFAAFAILDQATEFDAKYKGAIFKAVKDNNTAFNVIVGFASRDISTAIHEIGHALLRGMSDENKNLVIERFHHAARAKGGKMPMDIEEAWAGAFEAALMRGQFPQNYAAQKSFKNEEYAGRLLYDPVLQKTWEEVGDYLKKVRGLVIKKRDEAGIPVNAEYRSGKVFWEAPYKSTERVFKGMSLEVMMPGGQTEFGVVRKAQKELGAPIEILMNSGRIENIDPSQVTRIAGWTDGFNDAVLDLVANITRQNYTYHMSELENSNPELFAGYSKNAPVLTGSYTSELGTSPRLNFQTNVENELNQTRWFASDDDVNIVKKGLSGLFNSGRVILNDQGEVESVLDQRGKPSFAYNVLRDVHGYTPSTAAAMYAITETPDFKKWSGRKPLVEAIYNTDVRAGMPIGMLSSDEISSIRQLMSGIELLKVLKAAHRGDRSDDLIGDLEVLSKDYYGYNTPEAKKAAEMADFYTSDTDEANTALTGLIAALDYEVNKSNKFDTVRHLTQSALDYRSAMRKPRTGTGFVTMAFHPNDTHAWLPREGGYIIPNGVSDVDGVGRGGAYIRMDNPLVVDMKNNGLAMDRVSKYKEQAKAAGRDSVVLLNVRHSIGGASTLHNMVIPMNNHSLRVMDSMGKINLSTFFSGGGLIEAGSKDVATPIKAVEFDKSVASVYRSNHGDHVEVGDVRNVDIASMAGTEWFHASPVCKNYSVASTGKTENDNDITTAKSVVDVVDRIQPPVVTIENVKQYQGTDAFNMIIDALNRNGYNHQTAVYKTSDFGGSTMRERLLIRATRGFALPPITQNKLYKAKSWYEAVEDLIDDMPIGKLTEQQQAQFDKRGIDIAKIDQPYLLQSASKSAPQPMYGPAYTVMAGTGQAFRIVLPGGVVKVVTDRALARWQGLPDSYVLPTAHTLANKVVGNGVPTELTKYVLSPVAEAYMKHKAKQAANTAASETMMAFQSADGIDMPSTQQGKVTYAEYSPTMFGGAVSTTGKMLKENADFVEKSRAINDIKPGQVVATRLNINYLQNYKVPIQSVHDTVATSSRPYNGKVIAYAHAVTLNNPTFSVDQKAVSDISSGVKTKFPMAAVVGEFVPTPLDKHRVDGEVLRFNPKDTHLFVDSSGRFVKGVIGKVTSYGTKVYVHPGSEIVYWGENAPAKYQSPASMKTVMGETEMAFQSAHDDSSAIGNRVYTQPASPGAPSTVTRIMPRSHPSGYGRWWAAIDFLNDITRMVLSGDLAFTTLQAGIIGLSNPKVGMQAFLAGLKGFAPNMQIEVNGQKIGSRKLGREVYHQVGDQMRANPVYNLARDAGLKMQMFEIDQRFQDMKDVELANLRNDDPTATYDDCTTTLMDVDELGTNDEWYMKNRITRHLPGQGQFERYNSILHDTILLTQFDNWYKTLLSQGYEPGSEKMNKALKDTAKILNVSVGDIEYSTDATRDAAASRIAKVLFTAPRWLMSRALIDPIINPILSNSSWVRNVMGHDNPVFDLYKSGTVDPEVSKLGINMWLRVAGAQIAMMLMAILYQNWNPDVEANADKSFGRIRIGDVRFDPPAGIFDHYRLGIRLYQALLGTDPKNVEKAEKAGVPLWYYQIQDLQKEVQYKSSPLVNTAVSMFGGNDPAAIFSSPAEAQAKSVVGEPYYESNESFTFMYQSFLKPRIAELFGDQVANNIGFSNAFVERLPTVFPQIADSYYRAYEYDRPPLAYALAHTIPNFLGLKVEVTPAEYLKDRVKNRNQSMDSPNILKLLSQGDGWKVFKGDQ